MELYYVIAITDRDDAETLNGIYKQLELGKLEGAGHKTVLRSLRLPDRDYVHAEVTKRVYIPVQTLSLGGYAAFVKRADKLGGCHPVLVVRPLLEYPAKLAEI